MIKIENNMVSSTEGKFIRRKVSDSYFRRSTVLPGETETDFAEVDKVPEYTKAEYDAMVVRLVRQRYSADEEFAIQRKMIDALVNPMTADADSEPAAMPEFRVYNEFVNECKREAPYVIIEELSNRKEDSI